MGNKSWRVKVDPRHIHHTKINMPPGPHKQCATPPRKWWQVSQAMPWQETYLAQTHFRKTETTRNHPHQNVLVTRTKVKTLQATNFSYTYKTIVKPIWTYRIQLWGTASTYNIEILESFQSKALRMIVDAPWYVPNTVIGRDLQIPTVIDEIRRYSSQYSVRLSAHPNGLVVNLIELPHNRRLRRHLSNDLPTRFLV
jgi:hypothetical protein